MNTINKKVVANKQQKLVAPLTSCAGLYLSSTSVSVPLKTSFITRLCDTENSHKLDAVFVYMCIPPTLLTGSPGCNMVCSVSSSKRLAVGRSYQASRRSAHHSSNTSVRHLQSD